jgi:GTP-binding protein
MKFVDETKIFVQTGSGGNGCVSFRREKYVPRGGPNGGDGGSGGDVVITASPKLGSLLDHQYKQHYKARRGGHGKGKNQHGKDSPDLLIPVPLGTIVKDLRSDEIIKDLTHEGDRVVVAKGGRGGKGNARFATPTCQAPNFAEKGEDGEERWLLLELKLIADVGIIGLPNVGKSTMISYISRARSKIASYPFTTLTPHLGVVTYDDYKTFVVADIPGLIEGAHKGAGLGLQFLKHIERTHLLIHMIDISSSLAPDSGQVPERSPLHDFEILNGELASYDQKLAKKPQLVVLNKIDIPGMKEILPHIQQCFQKKGIETFPVSAIRGEGIDVLMKKVGRCIEKSDLLQNMKRIKVNQKK